MAWVCYDFEFVETNIKIVVDICKQIETLLSRIWVYIQIRIELSDMLEFTEIMEVNEMYF